MADEIKLKPLVVDISATTARLEKALKRIESQNRSTMNKVHRDALDGMKRFEGALSSADRRMAGFGKSLLPSLGAISGALVTREVIKYADAWTGAKNALAVAGVTGREQVKVLDALFNAAQKNAAPITALTKLYGAAAQASDNLGASQAELIKFSAGIATALRVAGTSASAASGALTQLGQLLGQARVQAEEFNSINEGARPILMAVAKGLDAAGGSVSKLKALVNDGAVSGRAFFDAFLKGLPAIEAMAGNAAQTIDQSWTRINNAMVRYVGSTDESLGASQRLVAGLNALADNFAVTADTALNLATVVAGALVGRSFVGLLTRLGAATAAVGTFTKALAAARTAGLAANLGALGAAAGPVGALIGGVVATSLIAFSVRSEEASAAAKTYAGALEEVRAKASEAATAIDQTTTSIDEKTRNAVAGGISEGVEDIAYLRDSVLTLWSDIIENAPRRLVSDEQLSSLSELRSSLESGTITAEQAEQALFSMANANPRFQRLAEQLSPLLSRLSDATAAVDLLQTRLQTVERDPRIDAYKQYGDSRVAGREMERAADKFEAEQHRRAELTREALELEQEIAKVRADADKEGIKLAEARIEAIAKANIAGDASRRAEGRSKEPDEFERLAKSVEKSTRALVAENDALSLLNPSMADYAFQAEKARIATELLIEAQDSGRPITDSLRAKIDALASAHAAASIAADNQKNAVEGTNEQIVTTNDLLMSMAQASAQAFSKGPIESWMDALDRAMEPIVDIPPDQLTQMIEAAFAKEKSQ